MWYRGNPWYRLLIPFGLLFRGLVALRRFAYRHGWLESIDVGVPVIVVGNLTVGGTGKTPLTIWLATRLGARGLKVGIVCRGYRGAADGWPRLVDANSDVAVVGDEARLLERRSACPVAAGPDRARAAELLLRSYPLDVVLTDDGLQHYRLARAFEIAVVDGSRGLGNGHCLPAGPLREPASRLDDVDAVVVNDGRWGPDFAYRAGVRVTGIYNIATGEQRSLESFRGTEVHAVAAIGNPDRFFALLARHGLVVTSHPLPDHAPLGERDLGFNDDRPVLITEKDAVKCSSLAVTGVWCVATALEFAGDDGDRLEREIMRVIERNQKSQ